MYKIESKDKSILKELCEAYGPSSNEKLISQIVVDKFNVPHSEIIKNNFGSLIVLKKSNSMNAKKIMVCAHLDEVGFMITDVDSFGFVRVTPIGGINDKNLLSSKVLLLNDKGKHVGAFIFPSRNLSERGNRLSSNFSINDLAVDFGFNTKEEALKSISIGEICTYESSSSDLINNKFVAKAIDNRAGTFIVYKVMDLLRNIEIDFDLYFCASTQEEVGTRGAATLSSQIKPDVAIVVDVSYAFDSLERKSTSGVVGEGVMIRHKDASVIQKRSVSEYMMNLCNKMSIKFQHYISFGGTDAGAIQTTNNGVLIMQPCIVAREIHSANSIASYNDIESSVNLVCEIIKDLSVEKIDSMNQGF
jgi:glutamyl aminopeptidase